MNKQNLVKPALLILISGFLIMMNQHAGAASFNCAKAFSVVENLICKDKSLSKKDDQLASVYKKALKFVSESDSTAEEVGLRNEQREWLNERNNCGSRDCLDYLYSKRILELKYIKNRYDELP